MSESSNIQVKDNRMFNPDGSLREGVTRVEAAAEPVTPPKVTPPRPEPKTAPAQQAQAPRPEREHTQTPPTPGYTASDSIDFPTFILSLASSVQVSLGIIPNPMTGAAETDLAHAKQTIDILGMLEQKTQGNLSPEESGLMRQVLFQLRMQYVEISKSRK